MRILVVEDNSKLAASIAKGLRENSYAVDVSGDGEDALYLVEINDYDLVLLDVMIPGPDGTEVCRKLRDTGKALPILMLTALDRVDQKIEGLDSGADDYLAKPFDFGELLARIRALLRRSQRPLISGELSAADLVLDLNTLGAKRAGKDIPLTAKEFSVLEFLMRNKGKAVGRAEIGEHCWDDSFDPMSNIIDVYIRRLRAKIDEGFETRLIETKRGAGYLLRDV